MNERFLLRLGALLPASLLLYLGKGEEIAAFLLPVLCHELGHVFAILLLGLRVRRFRLELRGFCIEYYGETGAVGHALAALAGPAAGFAWAAAAPILGKRFAVDWLCLSAGLSLLLSFFNLLPALPLDGGRVLLVLSSAVLGERRGERLTELISLLVGAGLLGIGMWLLFREKGAAVLVSAIWVLLYQENGRGLVKKPEMI